MSVHPFDLAIALDAVAPGRYRGHTSTAYANMIGPFGGITAAQLLAAVLRTDDRHGTPLACTVNFLAPVADGEFILSVRKTRQNNSSQHWLVELLQGDDPDPRANATVITALRRETWNAIEIPHPPVPPAADVAVTEKPALMRWPDSYEFRFIEGGFPSRSEGPELKSSCTIAWMRDQPPRPLDFPALMSLSDSFFPRVFVRRPRWVPAGTMSITTYFHCTDTDLAAVGASHLLAIANGQVFNGGFFDQTAHLWSDGGQCLATSHQIVYFKE